MAGRIYTHIIDEVLRFIASFYIHKPRIRTLLIAAAHARYSKSCKRAYKHKFVAFFLFVWFVCK